MELVLKPFILIYHIVSKILGFPMKLFNKTQDKVIEVADQAQMQMEQNQTQNLVQQQSYIQAPATPEPTAQAPQEAQAAPDAPAPIEIDNHGQKQEKRERQPLKGFKYTIINGVGKKENGTINAESLEDARSFIQQLDYEVLSVEERSKMDFDINIGNNIKAGDLSFSLTQLSTYIKAGIPLADSVKILAKQSTKKFLSNSL